MFVVYPGTITFMRISANKSLTCDDRSWIGVVTGCGILAEHGLDYFDCQGMTHTWLPLRSLEERQASPPIWAAIGEPARAARRSLALQLSISDRTLS